MQGKAHLLFGAATGAITIYLMPDLSMPEMGCLMLGTVAGSLYPDIDNKESIISNRLPIVSWFTSKIFTHREFIHSLLNVILLIGTFEILNICFSEINETILYLLILFSSIKLVKARGIILKIAWFFIALEIFKFLHPGYIYYAYGFLFGMLGHIFCDFFTTEGVRIFFPYKKYISFRNVDSGSPSEYGLVAFFGFLYFLILNFAVLNFVHIS